MKKFFLIAFAVLFLLTGCPAPSTGGRHEPGKHAATGGQKAPKPAPDPNLRGTEIGNIQFTVWVEQDNEKSTVTWNSGLGLVSKVGKKPGSHWDDTGKPGATVTGYIAHFHIGEEGRLWMQIVQNNNGHIVCTVENTDNRKAGAPACTGELLV